MWYCAKQWKTNEIIQDSGAYKFGMLYLYVCLRGGMKSKIVWWKKANDENYSKTG